jgi:hypothetical protein
MTHHDIHVNVVSAEEASLGVRDLTLRIEASADGVVLGAHALAEALAGANRRLALY